MRPQDPLSLVLRRSSQELSRQAKIARSIDDFIGDIHQTILAEKSDGVKSLQNIDRLHQSIEGMADFLDALADLVDDEFTIPTEIATRALKMKSQVDAILPRECDQIILPIEGEDATIFLPPIGLSSKF